MTNIQINYEHLANTVLKNCKKRNFTGSYAPTAEDAKAQIRELLKPGLTVAHGGSETLNQLGFRALAEEAGCVYLDRSAAKTPQEKARAPSSFMSPGPIPPFVSAAAIIRSNTVTSVAKTLLVI